MAKAKLMIAETIRREQVVDLPAFSQAMGRALKPKIGTGAPTPTTAAPSSYRTGAASTSG
ncbi:hypothetical protein MBRA_01514 [Methylobacterium brachiatum]|nr:hypothetical protein MBRA_01514 [Methylobacterium brachiatum]